MDGVLKLAIQVGTAVLIALLTGGLSLAVQFGCAVLSEDTSLNIFTRPTYQLVLWTLVTLAVMVLVWAVLGDDWAGIMLAVALIAGIAAVVNHYRPASYLFDGTAVTNTAGQVIYVVLALLWSLWVAYMFNRNRCPLIDES